MLNSVRFAGLEEAKSDSETTKSLDNILIDAKAMC
jgi:hypothetical protein